MAIKRTTDIIIHLIRKPQVFPNAVKVLKEKGFSVFMSKVNNTINAHKHNYKEPEFDDKVSDTMDTFKVKPLISIIIPVYNVHPKWLKKAIDSVEKQWYKNWELCIVDDASTNKKTVNYLKSITNKNIHILLSKSNENISITSNKAIEMAHGEYIALLDNDDELTVDALYEVVKRINNNDADFIYSDEDFISTNGRYINPHYKPDFSPDLLLSHNYITHFSVIKKTLLDITGLFNTWYDGAQDYELFLRVSEVAQNIVHIPKVLYHWRMLETSTSANAEVKPEAMLNGKNALEETMKRRNIEATVEEANLSHYFRVKRKILGTPLISIIIPFKDKPELLQMCLDSILNLSTYKNFEVIGISNNSVEKETFKMMKYYEKLDDRISFYEHNIEFNYSKINNYAVDTFAKGEHILLLNNDIEIISPSWIEALLEHSQRDDVGCVGAKLYYPDKTIQHAGIIMGLGGYAAHSHRLDNWKNNGYFNRLNVIQNLSAVTGACLMVKKEIYQAVKGLDEVNFVIAYNDVDFCLKVREQGYLNIYTPYCEAYHHESLSRGDDDEDASKKARFDKEKKNLKLKHTAILKKGDPYYNINLTLDSENFGYKMSIH